MIQNLILGILFLKIFWEYNIFIFFQAFRLSSSEFLFIFRFSSGKSQSQQKLAKKITHFTIQFRSKSVTHFTNLNSLDITPSTQPKIFLTSQIFQQSCFCLVSKKILHCTISWRSRIAFLKHFESKCLYISKYLLKKTFVSEM